MEHDYAHKDPNADAKAKSRPKTTMKEESIVLISSPQTDTNVQIKNEVENHNFENILVDKTDVVNRISRPKSNMDNVEPKKTPKVRKQPERAMPEVDNSVKTHKCYTIRVTSGGKEGHQCVYTCDICQRKFRNKRCSTKLCKIAPKDPYNKFYLCEICGKVFNYISSFIAHHNHKHADQKLFLKQARLMECTICHKKFSTKWNLKTHMACHTNNYPYLCEFCGKSFKKSDIFKVHLRVHTGVKPYSCPQCHKAFSTKGVMNTHLRTHTGEKPYNCEFCDKNYSGISALRTHRRMHTGERPFKCHLCPGDKSFISRKALRIHLKQPHHE